MNELARRITAARDALGVAVEGSLADPEKFFGPAVGAGAGRQ